MAGNQAETSARDGARTLTVCGFTSENRRKPTQQAESTSRNSRETTQTTAVVANRGSIPAKSGSDRRCTFQAPVPGPLDELLAALRGGACPRAGTVEPPPTLDPFDTLNGAVRSSVADRLWASATKRGACWISDYPDRGVGYPCMRVGSKIVDTHRVAFLIANGPIPDGLLVRHTCDVRSCVNPAHLLVGTYKDNHDDMVSRGRESSPARRAEIGRALRDTTGVAGQKIDSETAARIRAEWARGGHTHESLGTLFGLARSSIGRIVRGERWVDESRGAA